MKTDIKHLPKSEVEITIEISADELAPYMQKAAERISEQTKIEGFRPGKAPYNVVRARFGEAAVLEEAAESIVKKTYFQAIKENGLETVNQPKIEILKSAPGNPFIFKATVAILPEVKLGEYKNLGLKKEETKTGEEQIDKALVDLSKMQSKEALTDKPARDADKVIIDMDMTKDGVAVEGGQAKDMAVHLAEAHYIPGFNKELVGLKKGDEKSFSLNFPKEHYQKHLAGAKVDFKVKIKDVYEITPPEINDDFAKTLGQKSLEDLRALLRKNIEAETKIKDEGRWEIGLLGKIVENARFCDIPEILVNEESRKMVHELEHNTEREGMNFEDYLKSIKKTEPELLLDFAPEAVRRIKVALAIRAIAKAENIGVEDKEVAGETEKMMNAYKNNSEMQKQVRQPEFADYLRSKIENRKTLELIKQANI